MFSCFTDRIFLKRFLKISFPIMVGAFISFIVSFLDNLMVGTVSNEVVSGVYAANQVTFLFNLAMYGLLEGAGIFIEQYNGPKDYEHIRQCVRYKIFSTILFLIVTVPLVYLFGKDLIYIYSHSDSNSDVILSEGVTYLNIVMISFIPFGISRIFTSTLSETGNTRFIMVSGGVAIASNFIFNLIFIIFLKMGGRGAALATIIARVVELAFILVYLMFKKYPYFEKLFSGFLIEKKLFKEITKKGFLLLINEIGFSLGVVLQSLAFSQRDNVLSAISIVSTISNIFSILIMGLSVGIGVMVGSNLGSDRFKDAIDDNRKLNLLGVYCSLAIGLVLILLSKYIPYLFSEVDASQKVLASKLIIIYGSLLFANCLSLTAYYTLRVGGKALQTLLLDSGLMFVMYVPVAWILAKLTNLDLLYIYLIVRLLDVLKASIGLILVSRHKWVRNITIKNKEECFDN